MKRGANLRYPMVQQCDSSSLCQILDTRLLIRRWPVSCRLSCEDLVSRHAPLVDRQERLKHKQQTHCRCVV
jgi:hypothetical protein